MTNDLLDTLGGAPGDSAQSVSINGVITAVVTNTKDPETQGRIKVKFLGQGLVNETNWVRVASFSAGKERGAFFLPEVDDEVLVAFIRGNIDFPVVIGALWNGADLPPEKNAKGENHIKILKTRAGHTITFNDDSQAKITKIEIKSAGGHIITLDDATGGEKIEIIDNTGKNKIIMDATQKSVTIQGAAKLDIKSKAITIDATGDLTLKGGMVKITSTGIAQIKGAMVKIN